MAWQAVTVVRTLLRNDQRSIALDMPIAVAHAALLVGFAAMAPATPRAIKASENRPFGPRFREVRRFTMCC
jgi:hypothetical protein